MEPANPEPLLELPTESALSRLAGKVRRRWKGLAATAAITAGVVVAVGHALGGVAGLWEFYRVATEHHPASTPQSLASTGAIERPFQSIAVIPVSVESEVLEDKQLAQRITRELTAAAGRAAIDGTVASNASVQRIKTGPRIPQDIGRELNVRYLLDATMSRTAAGYELTIDLVDSIDGARLWTDQQSFAVAADAPQAVARTHNGLRDALLGAERKEILSLPETQRRAREMVLLAYQLGDSIAENAERQRLFEEALRIEPAMVSALYGLGYALMQRAESEPENREDLARRLDDVSLRATHAAPQDPRAWLIRTSALRLQRNWSGAFAANDEALRIDPFKSKSLTDRAALFILTGRPTEALPIAARVFQLAPGDPANAWIVECFAYLQLARDADAIAPCERGAALWTNWLMYALVTAAYANLGDDKKAADWKRRLVQANPRASIARLRAVQFSDNPVFLAQFEHTIAGLRRAGVAEK